MVDADDRQPGQGVEQIGQVAGIDVELAVPAGDLVDPTGQPVQIAQMRGAAAADVEPHRPDSGRVESPNVLVGGVGRYLGDSDESGTERRQRRPQIALVEALERARYDGTSDDAETGDPAPIVLDGERRRQVTVVLLQREPGIDDVQVASKT
jgi:hypothetical protein